jgi:hypothetical protein
VAKARIAAAFVRDAGAVYQTCSTTGRGIEFLKGYYGVLDRMPKGPDEGERGRPGSTATTSTTATDACPTRLSARKAKTCPEHRIASRPSQQGGIGRKDRQKGQPTAKPPGSLRTRSAAMP